MTQGCFSVCLFVWLCVTASAFGTQHGSPVSTTTLLRSSNANKQKNSAASRPRGGGIFRPTRTPSARSTNPRPRIIGAAEVATSLEGGYTSFHKTPEEYKFITRALLDNVMFTALPKETLDRLILAFEQATVNKGEVIVKQGDPCDGDYVYLVGSGDCTVVVDGNVVPEPYGTLKPQAIFGELGVLYNHTRKGTVIAKSDTVSLYRVNGDTFKSVLNQLTSDDDPELLEKIDQAIDQVAGTKSLYGGDIIRPYKPNRTWLWSRWQGTVIQHNYRTVRLAMIVSLLFVVYARTMHDPTWGLGLSPDKSHPFIQRLDIIRKLWSYQMSLTTFILTFFVQQAYSFWQDVHGIARRIQGRLNDFHLLLATGAKRNRDGTYTRESEKLMDDVGASSRLFHALFWASCARHFSVLRTPKGLERMATRGLMTSRQLKVLESLDVPNNQRHNACLEWMMIRTWQGIDDGTLRSDSSYSQRLMDQMCQLRGTYATIGDKLSCRMPLPYTHFVQILVDSFIALSPVALYPDLGAYSIFGVGILTLFYTGLLDLAKVFLDPLDNEDFTKNSIDMDLGVLIRESNAGSTRWKNSGATLPFNVAPRRPKPPPPPKRKASSKEN